MTQGFSLVCLFLIKAYQIVFPHIRLILGIQGGCRTSPSCSEYTSASIQAFGPAKGIRLGAQKIFNCHSLGKVTI